MEKSIFEFQDYRSYLLSKLGTVGRRTGLRSKACLAIGCHSTYLSQVLVGKTELSLEYGEAFNKFLNHTVDEGNLFILLVLRDRAGSVQLKERFQKQIDQLQTSRASLKKRIKESNDISLSDQNKFYGSWLYGALHVLVSLPHLQEKSELTNILKLSPQKISEALDFLESIGLIVYSENGFKVGSRHVHLQSDSQMIARHHTNWRFHSIRSLEDIRKEDLHYSGAIAMSKNAASQIRENLMQIFQENMKLVRETQEEVAYVYNFDYYRLDRK